MRSNSHAEPDQALIHQNSQVGCTHSQKRHAAVHLGTCLPLFKEAFKTLQKSQLDAGHTSFKLP